VPPDAVLVTPEHDEFPTQAPKSVVPPSPVIAVEGNDTVVLLHPPVTLHDTVNVYVTPTPLGVVADAGLIVTLAVPEICGVSASADANGSPPGKPREPSDDAPIATDPAAVDPEYRAAKAPADPVNTITTAADATASTRHAREYVLVPNTSSPTRHRHAGVVGRRRLADR
jgi:hypothetical protein